MTMAEHEYALVVPAKYEQEIIEVAHRGILSGHSGVSSTEKRIIALFYFQKMRQKVQKHFSMPRRM